MSCRFVKDFIKGREKSCVRYHSYHILQLRPKSKYTLPLKLHSYHLIKDNFTQIQSTKKPKQKKKILIKPQICNSKTSSHAC